MPFRYHAPVDPECPEVQEWNSTFWDDPMTHYCGCTDEIVEAFESRHMRKCEHCQEFGTANIEVRD